MAQATEHPAENTPSRRHSLQSWISSLSTRYSSTTTLVPSSSSRTSQETLHPNPRLPEPDGPDAGYQIGNYRIYVPLVKVAHLRAHLGLLQALKNLRTRLVATPDVELPERFAAMGIEDRWKYMVNLAVERFQIWVEEATLGCSDFVPPIDVVMVWHAYMLSPAWYAEDCDRIFSMRKFRFAYESVLSLLLRVGSFASYHPSNYDINTWTVLTRTSYDIFDALHSMTDHDMICPACIELVAVPFVGSNGDGGYFHAEINLRCPHCGEYLSKERSGLMKLARDVMPIYGRYNLWTKHLAGTLRTAYSAEDSGLSERIQVAFRDTPELRGVLVFKKGKESIKQLAMLPLYGTISKVRELVVHHVKPSDMCSFQRMWTAYTDDRPFSVDLVEAVLRQCSFINKMYDLGWLKPEFLDNEYNEMVLMHCLVRYHGYLDLVAVYPGTLLVPTLDVDLVWHTHQLSGSRYQDNCIDFLHRYLDHGDRLTDIILHASFEATCRAWQQKFGIPYTYCGCPPPSPKLGNRILSMVTPSNSSRFVTSPPSRLDSLGATHPSEHAVTLSYASESNLERIKARKVWKRRRDREEKKLDKDDQAACKRWAAHSMPFLEPLPLFSHDEIVKTRPRPGPTSKTDKGKAKAAVVSLSSSLEDISVGMDSHRDHLQSASGDDGGGYYDGDWD